MFPVYPVLAVFSVTKADSVQLQFEIVFVAPASNQSSAYLFQSSAEGSETWQRCTVMLATLESACKHAVVFPAAGLEEQEVPDP